MSLRHNQPILQFNKVEFTYADHRAFIDGLTFSLANGEFIGLLGANGSGKSTILKLACGILRPSAGSVSLWGKSLPAYRNKDRAKLLCYLPQLLDMQVPFRVRELVSMGLYPYDIPPGITVHEALELVGLTDKPDVFVTNLSGGERRRAFIAMTLLQEAGLILLDEPLANLDIKYQLELMKLLKNLQEKKNISIIMALHDINMALHFPKVMLIKEGSILSFGSPERVLTKDLLREAFDVGVDVRKDKTGGTYMSYEKNF